MTDSKNRILIREFTKSKTQVYTKLERLKKLGILKESLTSTEVKEDKEIFLNENLNVFETLEFYGDSVLYERITRNLIQTKRFCSPHLLSTIRSNTVSNKTLSSVYESLELFKLSNCVFPPSFLDIKQKADIIEAIIGEISLYLNSKSSLAHLNKLCDDCLDDLISYISYAGEASYFYTIAYNLSESRKVNDSTMKKNENEMKKEKIVKNDIPELICFNCSQKGHVSKNCDKKQFVQNEVKFSTSKFAPVRTQIKLEETVKVDTQKDNQIEETIEEDLVTNEVPTDSVIHVIKKSKENFKMNEKFHFKEDFTFDEEITKNYGTNEIKIDYDQIDAKLKTKKKKEKKKKEKQLETGAMTNIDTIKINEDKIIDFDDFEKAEDEENVIYLPKIFNNNPTREKSNLLDLDDFF